MALERDRERGGGEGADSEGAESVERYWWFLWGKGILRRLRWRVAVAMVGREKDRCETRCLGF